MPAHTLPLDNIPASATPTIVSESATHIVLVVEISKALLIGGTGRNHALLMSTLTPGIEMFSISDGITFQAVCARTRILIKLDQDDTN